MDADPRATRYIAAHAERLGIAGRCRIVCARLPQAALAGGLGTAFDVVLLDPPYDNPDTDAILSALGTRLAPGGVLVLEQARSAEAPAAADLTAGRCLVSGGSALTFYAPADAT